MYIKRNCILKYFLYIIIELQNKLEYIKRCVFCEEFKIKIQIYQFYRMVFNVYSYVYQCWSEMVNKLVYDKIEFIVCKLVYVVSLCRCVVLFIKVWGDLLIYMK